MSRPKSPERIQADADKAIRRERLDRKRTEREARRKERERKRATHESVVRNNGISKVQSGGAHLGIHDAIAYAPLVLCGGCGDAIRESILIGDLCPKCKYKKEVVDSPECLKAKQGDALEGGTGSPMAQKGGSHELPNAD